jgi:hypothetical protein
VSYFTFQQELWRVTLRCHIFLFILSSRDRTYVSQPFNPNCWKIITYLKNSFFWETILSHFITDRRNLRKNSSDGLWPQYAFGHWINDFKNGSHWLLPHCPCITIPHAQFVYLIDVPQLSSPKTPQNLRWYFSETKVAIGCQKVTLFF